MIEKLGAQIEKKRDELQEVEDEIEKQQRELEEEKEKYVRWMKVAKAERSVKFRKQRSRLLVRLGGEWANYAGVQIDPESDFEKIFEEQAERMNRIYKSLLRCPECGALLLREESKKRPGQFFWYCEGKCGFSSVWERNGVPKILGD